MTGPHIGNYALPHIWYMQPCMPHRCDECYCIFIFKLRERENKRLDYHGLRRAEGQDHACGSYIAPHACASDNIIPRDRNHDLGRALILNQIGDFPNTEANTTFRTQVVKHRPIAALLYHNSKLSPNHADRSGNGNKSKISTAMRRSNLSNLCTCATSTPILMRLRHSYGILV